MPSDYATGFRRGTILAPDDAGSDRRASRARPGGTTPARP